MYDKKFIKVIYKNPLHKNEQDIRLKRSLRTFQGDHSEYVRSPSDFPSKAAL